MVSGTVPRMRIHFGLGPILATVVLAISASFYLASQLPVSQAAATGDTTTPFTRVADRSLPLPTVCPAKPTQTWTMAVRGYFSAPGVPPLDDSRAWTLFENSVTHFQEEVMRNTRCAVGVKVDLFREPGPWLHGVDTAMAVPASSDSFLSQYDIVAYRFPVNDGESPYLGAAAGRIQYYPVSAQTEAPKKAVSATPYGPVLLHETLHVMTGWVTAQGVDVALPPQDVHAAPFLAKYANGSDMEFYQDYQRGLIDIDGQLTGLPPESLLQAGTPTGQPTARDIDPRLTLVLLGPRWYAWSASSAPLTVTYPTAEGTARLTRRTGTALHEGTLTSRPEPTKICLEQPSTLVFRSSTVCHTVLHTGENFIPDPDEEDAREPQQHRKDKFSTLQQVLSDLPATNG